MSTKGDWCQAAFAAMLDMDLDKGHLKEYLFHSNSLTRIVIYLCRGSLHMDIVFKRLKDSLWCCQGAHCWHPILRQMLTLATFDIEVQHEKSVEVQMLFWKLFHAAVDSYAASIGKLGKLKCNPRFFVFDGQGSFWTGNSFHKFC